MTLLASTAYPRIARPSGRPALRLRLDLQQSRTAMGAAAALAVVAAGAAIAVGPMIGAGIVCAAAMALVISLHPRVGVFLIVCIAPVTAGLRRGFPVPGVRLPEVMIAGAAVCLLASTSPRRALPRHALDWAITAYVLASFLVPLFDLVHRHVSIDNELDPMIGPLQFLLLYRAVATYVRTPAERRWCLRLVLLASIPVSLLAILQQFGPGGVRSFVASITGAETLNVATGEAVRVTGPFPIWHNLAGYLMIIVLLCSGIMFAGERAVLSRRLLTLVLGLAIVGLLETQSLTPIACTVAGVAVLGLTVGRSARQSLIVGVALVVIGLVFASIFVTRLQAEYAHTAGSTRSGLVPQTISYRYQLWVTREIPALSGHWLTGYGPEEPPALAAFPFYESQYFSLLLHGGLALLAVFMALMWAMAVTARRAIADADPLQGVLGRTMLVLLAALIVLDFIESYFVGAGVSNLIWVLLALLARDPRPAPRGVRAGGARLERATLPAGGRP